MVNCMLCKFHVHTTTKRAKTAGCLYPVFSVSLLPVPLPPHPLPPRFSQGSSAPPPPCTREFLLPRQATPRHAASRPPSAEEPAFPPPSLALAAGGRRAFTRRRRNASRHVAEGKGKGTLMVSFFAGETRVPVPPRPPQEGGRSASLQLATSRWHPRYTFGIDSKWLSRDSLQGARGPLWSQGRPQHRGS